MDWILYLIIAALAGFVIYMKYFDQGANTPEEEGQKDKAWKKEKNISQRKDFSNCYQPKYLLTKNEWLSHKKLKQIADEKGLIICPKVRLLDIVEPRKGEKDYKTLFYKIQAKHLDFVICNSNMKVLAVLELDDSSHDKKDRQQRDTFVDEVLKSCGYQVIRTRYITDGILDGLEAPEKE